MVGDSWILNGPGARTTAMLEYEERRNAIIEQLKASGEWPIPSDRTAQEIAQEYDAMRAMTDEERLSSPYAAHGNKLLLCEQLIAERMDYEMLPVIQDREPGCDDE